MDAHIAARIRAVAGAVERAHQWPGLADFMVTVAAGESAGRQFAIGDGGKAVGLYQIWPETWASTGLPLGLRGTVYYGTLGAIALAVGLARKYGAGTRVNWEDIRAGWRVPSWVDNFTDVGARGGPNGVRERFRARANKTGTGYLYGRNAYPPPTMRSDDAWLRNWLASA